jgi:hypothetical protein
MVAELPRHKEKKPSSGSANSDYSSEHDLSFLMGYFLPLGIKEHSHNKVKFKQTKKMRSGNSHQIRISDVFEMFEIKYLKHFKKGIHCPKCCATPTCFFSPNLFFFLPVS